MKRTVPWRAQRGPGAEWAPLSDPDTLAWGVSVVSGDPPSVWALCQRWPSRSPLFSVHTREESHHEIQTIHRVRIIHTTLLLKS